MYLIQALPKYTLNRKDGAERTYDTPDGEARSVTTVLDLTADKQGLHEWRENVGEEEADRVKFIAGARGTGTHSWIEQYMIDKIDPVNPDFYNFLIEPYWWSIKPFLQAVAKPLVLETTVYHPSRFAGTLDAIAYLNEFWYYTLEGDYLRLAPDTDQPTLVDWKTADKPLSGVKLYDYKLQVAAYRKAANYVYKPMGLNIRRAVIAVGIANDRSQIIELDESTLDQLFLHFLARLQRVTFARANQPRKRSVFSSLLKK